MPMIPIFTICFIVFIVVLTVTLKKNTSNQKEVEEKFWERERQANMTFKKDISNLEYITISEDFLPFNLGTDAEAAVKEFVGQDMVNLGGITNTELKLNYGVNNFEELSKCDTRFLSLVSAIPAYARELIDADRIDEARKLLKLADDNAADSKLIKSMLEEIN